MAQAKPASDEPPQLSDRERDAFQEILDLFIPDDFSLLRYNKARLIKSLMQGIEEDIAIVRLKVMKVLKTLKQCYEEEEPEEEEK